MPSRRDRRGARLRGCAGRKRLSLATRSDLTLEAQVTAPGATWIDRQFLARESIGSGNGFGAEVRDAMDRRVEHLAGEGLARRQGQRVVFARDLLDTLRRRELDAAARSFGRDGARRPPFGGGRACRRRLSSARHACIRPVCHDRRRAWLPTRALAAGPGAAARPAGHGRYPRGSVVDWSFGRKRGLGL